MTASARTDTTVPGTTELERLVARSRALGADPLLVVHGGGNTSSKIEEVDHLGRARTVLRIKGSGTNLATIDASGFPGLYLDELLPLRSREAMTDEEMVEYLGRCMVEPGSPRPSIETLLHAFVPARHVDHVHADAICALTNAPDGEAVVREVLGDDIAWVPYVRPGFELSRRVADLADRRAVVLAHHGLVTWGDTHEESLGLTLELVGAATEHLAGLAPARRPQEVGERPEAELQALLVALRGRLSRERRAVLHVDRSQRELADRPEVGQIATAGRSTPDHVLRIGTETLVVGSDAEVDASVDAFEDRYRAYFERNAGDDDAPVMHSPLPRVALVPGLGCVGVGATWRDARVRTEIAARSLAVAATTLDAFGAVEWLGERDLFEFDYWPMELAKLAGATSPELAGTIAIVTGAASGIGREVALDLARRGAHVVLGDLDGNGLDETAAALAPDQVATVAGDLTDEKVVDELVRTAVETFGGVDAAVLNAGIGAAGRLGDLTPDEWRRSLEINATSHFLLTRRLWPVLERQGIGGSLVYVASKNAFGPGAGFGAYSAAKAAQVQLARIAALEGGSIGVRANAVNPDAVFAGSRLWSDELRRERAEAHGVALDELESFYAGRSLLGVTVTPADVAEAVAFLVSDRSRATTGCVLTVDGGVAAAFPR